MSEVIVQESSLTAVADAIREKTGTSGTMIFPEGFVEAVGGISAGSSDPSEMEALCIAIIEKDDEQITRLPDGLTEIGSYAFINCTRMELESIPDTVETIGSSAFANCYELKLKALPKNLTDIGGEAFYNCSKWLWNPCQMV